MGAGLARRTRTRLSAVLIVAVVLLSACSSHIEGEGALVGTPVGPDRETRVTLSDGSFLTVPEGAVSDPGVITVDVVDPADEPPPGLYLSGPTYAVAFHGTTLVTPYSFSFAAPPKGGAEPDAAALGWFDEKRAQWTPVDAAYEPRRLTGTTLKTGLLSAVRVDTARLLSTSTGLLDSVKATEGIAEAPVCQGDPAASRITTEISGEGPVLHCVGVADGAPQVVVADDRGATLSVSYPVRWVAEPVGERDAVAQASLDTVNSVPVPKKDQDEARTTVLVTPGTGLRLTNPPDKNGALRIEPSARAYVATALDYAADVLDTVTTTLPWFGGPTDPEVSATLFVPSFTAEDCRASLGKFTRAPTNNPEQVGMLFRQAAETSIGCLSRGWAAAQGREGWQGAGLQATLTWIQKNIVAVFGDGGPTIGPALDFPLFKMQVTQTPA